MKKLTITLIVITLIITGCKKENFSGYIVAKTYTHTHMDNESVKTISYSTYIPVVVPHRHRPKRIPDTWLWYVANKNEVREIRVSRQTWLSKQCGQKVIIIY